MISISRLGLAISRVFERTAPDPFVIAILLTLLTAALALAFGVYPPQDLSLIDRAEHLLDAWRDNNGIWKLLSFSMQMCLILVTGHALAATKPVRRMIGALAATPKSTAGGAALVCAVACTAGLINWGLGLIVGALIAREVGISLARRSIPVHYPLIVAAGYMALLVFHGGLSGSAPLSATTAEGAKKVLSDPDALALIGDGIGLERTLLSSLNLFVTGGLVIILPVLFWLLAPTRAEDMQPPQRAIIESHAPPDRFASTSSDDDRQHHSHSIPDRLERTPLLAWPLALLLLLGFARYIQVHGALSIQINEVNALMFGLGLILHGSLRSYAAAVEDGARDCAGIIIQFPIYAGIMALMTTSGLVGTLTNAFTRVGDAQTLPVMSFIAATLVGLFVPSGGAQWGLQGPIALQSGAAAGVEPGAMLMSVAYGDELANMLQPFWALPLLAITGVRARDIVGYTAIAMLVGGVWIGLGLLIF
jgi:short-chain fatty acids transporter